MNMIDKPVGNTLGVLGPGSGTSAITLESVSMVYGEGDSARTIIDNLSFSVGEGEFLSIVGASGCGKTTLLRMLSGLVTPTLGTIDFFGERISGPSRDRAMVFQDYGRALLPWRTVGQNINLALETCGVSKRERPAIVKDLASLIGLTHALDQYPHQLSGGMQQRVQIARCLAQRPKLLLMDEPFGALDAITRQGLQDEVLSLAKNHGTTVVFITHDLEEAIYLGDRVVVLAANPGRIVEDIAVDIAHPRNQLTTREDPRFLSHRHHIFGLLEGH